MTPAHSYLLRCARAPLTQRDPGRVISLSTVGVAFPVIASHRAPQCAPGLDVFADDQLRQDAVPALDSLCPSVLHSCTPSASSVVSQP